MSSPSSGKLNMLYGKRDFAGVIKNLELGRVPWIIPEVGLCNHHK